MFRVTRKRISRWDEGWEPAGWESAIAARKWAESNIGKGGFKIFEHEQDDV